MKHLSIKFFTIFIFIFIVFSEGLMFYDFFKDSEKTTENLLEKNMQSRVLNIKHFLEKNLRNDNINQLRAYLDNITNANPIIADIHIIKDEKKILYSTDRGIEKGRKNLKCISISEIRDANIFKQRCYSFSIRQFRGLSSRYLIGKVYLEKKYLTSFVENQITKYVVFFLGYFLLFMFVLWMIIDKYIINPLEKLRQFAYYSTKIPKKLFIVELESIRYSLDLTFKRLKKEQEDLYHLSTRDSLSGLHNRLSLIEKINWLIDKGKRKKTEFVVLFLDLDNFKDINDSQGHEFGDELLKYISRVLLSSIRSNDIVSRFGGDEFVIILPDTNDSNTILGVIQRIKQELSKTVIFNKRKYSTTCSIGITIYPKDGTDVTTLLKNADIAMYKTKELGKNGFHFFTEKFNDEIQRKIYIQELMKDALEKNYFKLFYQPKVDIETNKIVGCEALVRLIDPVKGIIPPNDFISIAEENNFIILLGKWIIEEATRQLREWKDSPLKHMRLSINVSSVQFKDNELYDDIKNSLLDVDSSKLDIEITETVLMQEFEQKLSTIREIKKLGVTLSLDDFGTGYSSLSYLKNIPFDTLKIDKSFIDDLEDEREHPFLNMIMKITNELNLEVVAEGVETKEQLKYLKSIGCEQYQGYYCSKPLPIKEFEELFYSKKCK